MKTNARLLALRRWHWVKRRRDIFIAAVIFFVATASFMWPMFTHLSTYSGGGDHMFNAWTLARNHHCFMHQNCEDYTDGNIFFPNEDSMLYSETQFSAGLLSFPFYLINQSPLFATNVWYLVSIFLSAFFMYLLARHLSKRNQPVSVLAGLLFAFGPTKITSMDHLQNLSIFYLPLIILLLLKYRETASKKYLAAFALTSSLLFLASWYQMVFGLAVIGLFILFVLIVDRKSRMRGVFLGGATLIAILTTLPLAKEYVRFSDKNDATFSIDSQIKYSASINDYFLPYENTVSGTAYYKLRPDVQRNSHNPDSFSYTGITLYVVFAIALIELVRRKKRTTEFLRQKQLLILLAVVAAAGFFISLGPFFKIGSQFKFNFESFEVALAAPYLLVDKFLPQLSFMRAIGRASVIVLFALCCVLAIYAIRLKAVRSQRKRIILTAALIAVISIDLLPLKLVTGPFEKTDAFKTSFAVPKVYEYVKNNPGVDDLVVIRSQKDYPNVGLPTAVPEDILWSGYHTKDIFNGYSGYYPPMYQPTLDSFVSFNPGTEKMMKTVGLDYVILDKALSKDRADLKQKMTEAFSSKVYEDSRYVLFKI